MATNSKEASLAIVINVFTVAPEKQQQLASMLATATNEAAKDMPGFVSATIHSSDDGTRVANYAQWRRREDLEAALASPRFQQHIEPIMAIAKPDAHVYDVVDSAWTRESHAAAGIAAVKPPDLGDRPHQLVVERTMRASRAVLYRAFTERLDDLFAVRGTVLMRPAVRGPYFDELTGDGKRDPHDGPFLRLQPGEVVRVKWVTPAMKGAETVVSIELAPAAKLTLLRLAHAGFPDEESKERHEDA